MSDIEYSSKVVHTFAEDRNFQLHKTAPGAIATWADFHEGVEVFVSSVGAVDYNGYWIEGLGSPSTRAFVSPMGGLSNYIMGKDVEGTFTYWAPYAGEQNKDFSKHLQFSPNGAHSYYEIYQDGGMFGIAGIRRFEIPHNVIAPMVHNDGSVSYIARVRKGVLAIFVDGKIVSPEFKLESVERVIEMRSDDGKGYLYGVSHSSGAWFLKDGKPVVVDVSAPIKFETISPDGTRYGYVYERDGLLRAVIDDESVEPSHSFVSPIVFSYDSQHWHFFGSPVADKSRPGTLETSDGPIPNLTDVQQTVGYVVGDARPTYVALQNGAKYVFSGKDRFGPYEDPRGLKFSLNHEHFSYVLMDDNEAVTDIIANGQAQRISLAGKYLYHRVSDKGDLYHYEQIGDVEVAFKNGHEIVRYSNITNFALAHESGSLIIVGIEDGSNRPTLWIEGVGEVFSADNITILETGDFDLLATWVRDDGQTYLTLEGDVIGGFDEILFEGKHVADFTETGVSFFARNGRDILEVTVPRPVIGTKKLGRAEAGIASLGSPKPSKDVSNGDRSDVDVASRADQSVDKRTEEFLRKSLAEGEAEIEALKAALENAQAMANASADREQKMQEQLALANDLLDALKRDTETNKAKQAKLAREVERLAPNIERLSALVEWNGRAIEAQRKLLDTSSPEVVLYVQNRLVELGYDAGVPDGKIGGKTRRAIESFVIEYGLPIIEDITPELITYLAAGKPPKIRVAGSADTSTLIKDEQYLRLRAQSIAPLRAAMGRTEIQPEHLALFFDVFDRVEIDLKWDESRYETIDDLEVYFCFSDWHSPTAHPLKNAFRDFVSEYKISQRMFQKFDIPGEIWSVELDRAMEEAIAVAYPFLKDFTIGELNAEQTWDFQAEVGKQIWPHLKTTSDAISRYFAATRNKVLEITTIVRCI